MLIALLREPDPRGPQELAPHDGVWKIVVGGQKRLQNNSICGAYATAVVALALSPIRGGAVAQPWWRTAHLEAARLQLRFAFRRRSLYNLG